MKSNSSEGESLDPSVQNLEDSASPGNLSGANDGFNASALGADADYLSRDKGDVQRELADLNDQLEAKKLEVAECSRQVTELSSLLECKSAQEEALRIVDELEQYFCSQEEAQLRVAQLQYVQEELEHYYLLSRHQARLLDQSNALHKKAFDIISDLALNERGL